MPLSRSEASVVTTMVANTLPAIITIVPGVGPSPCTGASNRPSADSGPTCSSSVMICETSTTTVARPSVALGLVRT